MTWAAAGNLAPRTALRHAHRRHARLSSPFHGLIRPTNAGPGAAAGRQQACRAARAPAAVLNLPAQAAHKQRTPAEGPLRPSAALGCSGSFYALAAAPAQPRRTPRTAHSVTSLSPAVPPRAGHCCDTASRAARSNAAASGSGNESGGGSSSSSSSANGSGSGADAAAAGEAAAAGWGGWLGSAFRASPYDGAIFSLALPAVIALAADPLLSIVDTVFVGQAGAEPLAALGVNSALFSFSFVVFNFLATATTPLVAAALAQGDAEKVRPGARGGRRGWELVGSWGGTGRGLRCLGWILCLLWAPWAAYSRQASGRCRGQPLCANSAGRRRIAPAQLANGRHSRVPRMQAGKVTLQALLLASVLGCAVWGGLAAWADPALALMGAGPETGAMHQLAKDFLLVRCSANGPRPHLPQLAAALRPAQR